MRPADRAIGILAQLEFAELHAQRVDQQQASDQRLAFAENQLDHFGGLHHADQPGQNAQHSALGAGRNQSRRRRLGIQAAIARAIFGGEDAGLAFEAENRSVNIRLAGEHAGVVHQIARGKLSVPSAMMSKSRKSSSAFSLLSRVSNFRRFRKGLSAVNLSAAESSFLRPTSAVDE
jgi:hypothetical protein